jgi:hypothetical protein
MGSLDSLLSERSSASRFRDLRRGTSPARVLFGNRTYNLHFHVRLSARAHRMTPPFLTCACLSTRPLRPLLPSLSHPNISVIKSSQINFNDVLLDTPLTLLYTFPAAIRFTNLRRPLFLHLIPSKGTYTCGIMLDLAIQCSEGSSQVDGVGGRRYREGQ